MYALQHMRFLLEYWWGWNRWCLFCHKRALLLADRFSPLLLYQVLATLNSPGIHHIYKFLFRFQASFLTPSEDSVSMNSVKKQIISPCRGVQYLLQGEYVLVK